MTAARSGQKLPVWTRTAVLVPLGMAALALACGNSVRDPSSSADAGGTTGTAGTRPQSAAAGRTAAGVLSTGGTGNVGAPIVGGTSGVVLGGGATNASTNGGVRNADSSKSSTAGFAGAATSSAGTLGSGGTVGEGAAASSAGATPSGGATSAGNSSWGNASAGRGAASGGTATMGTAGRSATAGAAGSKGNATDAAFCKTQLDLALTEYDLMRKTNTNPSKIPRSYKGTTMSLVSSSDWTSGFVAGSFWYLYEHSGDASWRTTAESWTDALYAERFHTSDHDVGFIIHNSYGNGYRLTSNSAYADVLKTAAGSLASRYNAKVGAIRSWDYAQWTYPVIIDNMMNLELLWHATELGADAQFAEVAVTHALTTDKNHFRSDNSSYHVVDYDPTTGAIIAKKTAQGISDASAWARGQAWGLYGFTMAYRKTGDRRFLNRALSIAEFYMNNPNLPSDGVPYFDFDAPKDANVPDYRDSSAGAIAASALFELYQYAPAADAPRYLAFAIQMVRSLSSSQYRAAANSNGHFLLLHSVGNYPQGSEVDVGINYADYYYIEGLLRCKALN